MFESSSPIVERLGRVLQRTLDQLVHQPTPERRTDLIARLNAEGDRMRGSTEARES